MTTYNTQNPIGSTDPRDLYDNAENLDEAVNSDGDTFHDRLGKSRLTWAGMENQFESDQSEREVQFDADQTSREQQFRTFIASSGYQFAGEYAAGIEITQYNQLVRDENGEFWRVSGQVDLPYVTTGAGIPEDDALVPAGDAVLRQDLTNPDKGAAMVARGVVAVDSIADLLSLPEGQRKEGLRYLVRGYHAGSDVGGGEFYFSYGDTSTTDGVLVFGTGEGRFHRLHNGHLSMADFGSDDLADLLARADQTPNSVTRVSVPAGSYSLPSGVTMSRSNLHLKFSPDAHVECFPAANAAGIHFTGEVVDTVALAVDAAPGETSITLSSLPVSAAAGGVLRLVADDLMFAAARVYDYKGEMFEIAGVSGSTVTLSRPLYFSYSTTNNARVEFIRSVDYSRISGGRFVNSGAEVAYGVQVQYSRDFVLDRVTAEGFNHSGLSFYNSLGGTITRCAPKVYSDAHGLNYGITVYRSYGVHVTRNRVFSKRTAVDMNSGAMECFVHENNLVGNANTHTAVDCTFSGNIINNGTTLIRGVGIHVIGNKYKNKGNPTTSHIGFDEAGAHGPSFVVGNYFEGVWRGLSADGAHLYMNGSEISGNTYIIREFTGNSNAMYSIRTSTYEPDHEKGLTITGNTFEYTGAPEGATPCLAAALTALRTHRLEISGNRILRFMGGVYIEPGGPAQGDNSDLRIRGNTISLVGGDAISWRHSDRVDISGNTLIGGGSGRGILKLRDTNVHDYYGFSCIGNTISGFQVGIETFSSDGSRYYNSVIGMNSIFDVDTVQSTGSVFVPQPT